MRFKSLTASAAVFLSLAAFHCWSLKSFPRLILDEGIEGNHAYNILTRGENVYSLFEDIFPPAFAPLEHAFPNVLRPFYNLALAGVFALAGVGPWAARSLSLICSFGSLALVAWLGWRWTGSWRAGLSAALFLGFDFIFCFSAHQARPEAMLGFVGALVFACFEWAEERAWCLIPAGFLAAAAGAVHTNGAGLGLAAAAVLMMRSPSRWLYFVFGAVLGGTLALFFIHPERFLPAWVVFQGFFSYSPPLRAWSWNVGGAFGSEMTKFLSPPFFGPEARIPGLAWSLRLEWSLIFGIWLAGCFILKDKKARSLIAAIGVWEAFYTCYVAIKGPNYASSLEPLIALLFAVFLHRAYKSYLAEWRLKKIMLAGLSGASVFCHGSFFLLTPILAAFLPGRKAAARYLHILAALMPLWCLRVFLPDVFSSLMASAAYHLQSPLEDVFLAASLAGFIFWIRKAKRDAAAGFAGWLTAGLLASLAVNACFQAASIFQWVREDASFDSILFDLRRQVPAGSRVLGPQQIWYGFWDQPYRDWDGLAYAKWLTGRGDATPYLARWRPDFLITDCRFRDTFLKRRRLDQVITAPMRKVGVVEAGGKYCDPFEIYRLRWR